MPTIDADAHVLECASTWDYMDESEREMRPQIVTPVRGDEPGTEFWLIDGRLQPKSQNVGKDTPEASREMQDVEARIRHMDELDVDVQVLYPTVFLRPLTTRPEVELALCKSYNRWLADIWRKGKNRLRWIAVLPLLNIEKAIEELKIAKENGACGLFIRGVEGERRISDPYFFPLYEEASRMDMPVCVHSATGSFALHDFFVRECGFSKFKLAVVGAFHSLIYDDIPDMFPKLRFAFVEVSSQWIPYVIHDLALRFRRQERKLKKDLLRKNRIYVACQTDDDLAYILQYAGEDNLIIGSDYGHADTATEIEALRKLKQDGKVSPAAITKILDQNARTLYRL
ncbi:MAG: amidohydrolase family protein [Candidatus Binatia bacterium]